MNYQSIKKADIANGIGWRTTIWVCGCNHNCPYCFNPQTHNPDSGQLFDQTAKDRLFNALSEEFCDGLTLSGGDPLFCSNIPDVYELVMEVKSRFPTKTIWLYTGYSWEQILQSQEMMKIMQYVDVLVDGEFKIDKKDSSLPFRGSSNQRIINVQKSIELQRVVELEL